ncbi:MAG: molybdopterin-dependent oxidoreductase [Chloroflexota bacterium]
MEHAARKAGAGHEAAPATTVDVTLTVNGEPRSARVEARTLLVDLLRDQLGLTGTKSGCDTGECGACTVHLDGRSAKSCLTLAAQADGATVTTIEGLAPGGGALHPIQEAFWKSFAVQNGYSTPGIVMSVADLLERNPHPSEPEIRDWLDGTLTRISGYQNVVRAVEAAAAAMDQAAASSASAPAADAGAPATPPAEGIGASIPTKEAPELLTGAATFVADLKVPGALDAAILFSDRAHARIARIDTSRAKAMPGVVGVFTAADIAGLMPMPVVWVPKNVESHFPPHPSGMVPGGQSLLAKDVVRFVGDQVAVVVAETRAQAHDALAAIEVDYEPLPVVTDAIAATQEGAPQLHEAAPNNLLMHWTTGDKDAADAAIAGAEVVVKHRFVNQRMMANTVETRGSIGRFDAATGEYTLWTNVQPTYPVRLLISLYVLGIPYSKLRVIVPNSGGSQGSKGYLYADAPLVLHLSKVLGRPVRWIDTRAGLARSTVQGRDQIQDVTIAGSKDGRITGLSVTAWSNIGAYPVINAPGQPTVLVGRSVTGQYAIEHPFYEVNIVYTNTVPVGPLRGSGRAEATYLIERAVDLFAARIGKDPAEVRRLNQVQPDQQPYDNRLGWTYDSGDYPAALERALAKVGYADLDGRRAEAKARGKRLGVGIGSYVAVAGVGPSAKMGDAGLVSGTWGSAVVRVQPSGEVTVTTGAQPHGQSQETTFAQIVANELGIPTAYVSVSHSDTNGALYYGQASYGSRSLSVEGSAVHKATQAIKAKAIAMVSHLFKAPPEYLVFENGRVHVAGNVEQGMTLQQIAFVLWLAWDLPPGMDPGLEASAYFDPPDFNYPFGTHVALVEVDEATGQVDLVRYVAVDDFGVVVNPGVVDGQTHGNIALGVGQALLEEVRYDADGRLLTDSFATYPIPRASTLPSFETERTETPSPVNPLGAKGAGDVSNPAVAPAVVNAVVNALADLGIEDIATPATPERVWRALQAASKGAHA